MTDTSNYYPMFMQPPQPMPQPGPASNLQPQDLSHVNDVLTQYVQNKQQQQNGGLLQQILSNRMQPDGQDAMNSIVQTASSFGAPQQFSPITPDAAMASRISSQLSPYSDALKLAQAGENLSGTQMQNQITAQTGLPMAQTELAQKQLALMISQRTGLPLAQAQLQAAQIANEYAPAKAQAEIGLEGAQTTAMNEQVQRANAEKLFDYQNNPQMKQANMMAQYLQNASGAGTAPTPTPQQNGFGAGGMTPIPGTVPANTNAPQQGAVQPVGQPAFNPMGAMLAKQLGLDNMQIGPDGQPQPIPGMPTAGQKEIDKNFADSLQTFQNAGGAKRLQNSLQTIDDVINQLKTGKLTTGGTIDALSMKNGEPTDTGQLLDRKLLVARSNIGSSILPQAKSLFGSRVTNFDAQSLINSQGLDPMADVQTNLDKLMRLRASIVSGQQDLMDGGAYFNQHGTLAGYQPSTQQQTPSAGGATHIYDPASGQLVPAQ